MPGPAIRDHAPGTAGAKVAGRPNAIGKQATGVAGSICVTPSVRPYT
jgi:hypothetical protein